MFHLSWMINRQGFLPCRPKANESEIEQEVWPIISHDKSEESINISGVSTRRKRGEKWSVRSRCSRKTLLWRAGRIKCKCTVVKLWKLWLMRFFYREDPLALRESFERGFYLDRKTSTRNSRAPRKPDSVRLKVKLTLMFMALSENTISAQEASDIPPLLKRKYI